MCSGIEWERETLSCSVASGIISREKGSDGRLDRRGVRLAAQSSRRPERSHLRSGGGARAYNSPILARSVPRARRREQNAALWLARSVSGAEFYESAVSRSDRFFIKIKSRRLCTKPSPGRISCIRNRKGSLHGGNKCHFFPISLRIIAPAPLRAIR